MPGNDRTGNGASTARSTPAGTSITPRGLASAEATLAHDLAGRDARARGKPSSSKIAVVSCNTAPSIARRRRDHRCPALRRGVPVRGAVPSVKPLAAREVQEHLVDAGDQHRRSEATRDLADAFRVGAVDLVSRGQIDRVRRELARLHQRHARLHAEPSYLVAGRGDHAAASRLTADDNRFALERRIEQALDRHEERIEIQAADPGRRQWLCARELEAAPMEQTLTDHLFRYKILRSQRDFVSASPCATSAGASTPRALRSSRRRSASAAAGRRRAQGARRSSIRPEIADVGEACGHRAQRERLRTDRPLSTSSPGARRRDGRARLGPHRVDRGERRARQVAAGVDEDAVAAIGLDELLGQQLGVALDQHRAGAVGEPPHALERRPRRRAEP